MIIEKEVEIKLNKQNREYYIKLGYYVNSDTLIVKVEHLTKGSSTLITSKCDVCGLISTKKYQAYFLNTKKLSDKYYCQKCKFIKSKLTNLEKYGTEYVFQSKEIKNKIKKTNLENYGVEYVSQSKEIQQKIKETNLEKYGVEYVSQSKEIQQKIKETNLEKYGVEHYSNTDEFKLKYKNTSILKYGTEHILQSKEIQQKIKETNLEKYGVVNILQSEKIKNKIKKTNLDKYGTEYGTQSKEIKNKISTHKSLKTLEKYQKILTPYGYFIKSYKNNVFNIYHKNCKSYFNIFIGNIIDRIKDNVCLCTECYPIAEQKSIKEKEIINWLNEHKIEFIESDKTILKPKHLDIYIPFHNLAIEFNGLYHHSELKKDKNYHLEKSLKCQEQGIQLLHIWEDEWVYKKDIIKSIVSNKLNIIENKIYARQCEIRVIYDSKLVRGFLDTNHIQGYSQSSIKLGLFYQNELVSLMTFGYRHTNAKKEFELIRFCNRINLNVIGAASKLFNYFKQNYQFTELISYSDFRLFDGKMYKTLGFTKQHLSKPDYFWCKNLERKHRFNFNKQKLIKEGFDGSKTEVEIMHERGYFRVFGCGQYKWIYKNNI